MIATNRNTAAIMINTIMKQPEFGELYLWSIGDVPTWAPEMDVATYLSEGSKQQQFRVAITDNSTQSEVLVLNIPYYTKRDDMEILLREARDKWLLGQI